MRKDSIKGRSDSKHKSGNKPSKVFKGSKYDDQKDDQRDKRKDKKKDTLKGKPTSEQKDYRKEKKKDTFKSRKTELKDSTKENKDFKKKDFKQEKPLVKRGYKLNEEIRLNRFLANSGVCSRREADNFISTGCVTVNGKIVSELGSKVTLNDDVRFNGEQLNPQKKVYLLLNKPKGFVTTTDDPQERKTVMDLVKNACTERIYPVGRLDKDTTGVLLFTNDGDLAKKLTHPSYNKKKIYHVYLDKSLTKNHLLDIAKGIELEDGFIAADAIKYVDENDKREIGIEIHSGKNRIVRRIFAHMGYEVQKLDRVYFAGLTKKNTPRGKSRFLTPTEITQLKMQ